MYLAALALATVFACRGDGPTTPGSTATLIVVVTDAAAGAAVGVLVRVDPGGRTQPTGALGVARFTDLQTGSYTVTVQNNGSTIERQVELRPPSAEVHVVLTPAGSPTLRLSRDELQVDWGAPESLRVTVENGGGGEVVWVTPRDHYFGRPVVLGRGLAITTAALRPGTNPVEARLVVGAETVASAGATVTVRYRESWNMDLLGLVPFPDHTVGDVWMSGRLALVARRGASGFSVVDVDRLAEIGRFDLPGAYSQDIHANGSLVYVTNESQGFRHAVTIVDISDPAAPREVGGIPHLVTPGAHTVWVEGTTAFLANPPTRLIHVWDIADPANPSRLSMISGGSIGVAHDMYVRNGILYGAYMALSGGAAELVIANVQNPANPVILARTSYPDAQLTHSAWLTVDGRYLYVADEITNAPVRIFDVSSPTRPVLAGLYQPRLGTVPHHFQVRDGRYAYLANYKNGVEVLDISDPLHPRLVGFYDTHPGVASDGAASAGNSLAPAHDEGSGQALYEGAWGVHWTDDGKIVVSDMNRGLFVLLFSG